MEPKFTTKVRSSDGKYVSTFSVGAQTFTVYKGSNEGIALWYEKMLIFALNNLTNDTTTGEPRAEREEGGKDPE